MAARSDQLVESDSLVDLVVPIDASDDPIVGGGATAGVRRRVPGGGQL